MRRDVHAAGRDVRDAADETGSTSCATCGAALAGGYCHVCGEKRRDPRDLTLGAFAHYAVEAVTNADAKLYTTLRVLVARPGLLTREFVAGRRRPYVGPLQLFLAANLAFFVLLQFGWGPHAFTMDFVFHPSQPLYGSHALSLIEERVGRLPTRAPGEYTASWMQRWSEEQLALRDRFNEASPRYANSLVILMVPLLAAGLRLLRRRSLFVRELVLSLNFFAFLLLLLLALPAPLLLVYVAVPPARPYMEGEAVFAAILITAMVAYMALAFRNAHGDGRTAALLRALVVPPLLFFITIVYRVILFYLVFRAV